MASYEAGAGGVAAVLYRSLYEVWLWGHYLLADQDEAVKRLFGEREWFVERMTFGDTILSSEGVPAAEPGLAADNEEPWGSVSPNIREVALRVADLRGPEYRSVVLTVHEGAWRRACFVAAHLSWAVLERYAEQEETAPFASVGKSPRPWATEEDNEVTHTCAALVLDLAEQVVGASPSRRPLG
ncbi:MAG: hypothetical protein LC799_31660 [Actinobacteria bacterium]|nr:hypothetical protein [Actinomycetota bacterium]